MQSMSVERLFMAYEDVGVMREVAIDPVGTQLRLVKSLADDIELGEQRPIDRDLVAEEWPEKFREAAAEESSGGRKANFGVRLRL
jgi:hypothetical protein